MGILDEAIREHLELKRQHGADESELKGLEDEAFGQADRPDATTPGAAAEAETQVISPGSSLTSPAGEGDQLDKVFEATRQAEADTAAKPAEAEAPAAPDPEATFAEHPVPEPPAPASAEPETDAKAEETVAEAATVESPEAKPSEPAPEPPAVEEEGDAGDMLEAERHHLASHPTEHYDVDAAIAEEDEIDLLSESSLSDELDRALDSGEVASGGQTVEYDVTAEPDSAEYQTDEPESAEFPTEDPVTEEPVAEEDEDEVDSAELLYEDAAAEDQPTDESETEASDEESEEDSSDFYDQEDVLEATPEFLEETPEHDRLWFEQKEPKDFDFGD
ncbi:MAG: hypothetical protein J0H98_00720 [Solirubrobacterales bacterium]|nr:hypothetical protein [Solirubrobacterales bacterium]